MGLAKRMVAGGSEGATPYWGGFDAMRVLCRKFNDNPAAGSRPLSATACGCSRFRRRHAGVGRTGNRSGQRRQNLRGSNWRLC